MSSIVTRHHLARGGAFAGGPLVRGGSSLLDVATGPGYVAGRGASVVGADFSEEMLALARSLEPSASFVLADAGALPFGDGSFDSVVANFLMPHVSDLPAVVAELVRVMRPAGRLALTTWDGDVESYTSALFTAIAESGAAPPPELPQVFQYCGSDEFTALLEGAGLVDVSVTALRFTHRAGTDTAHIRRTARAVAGRRRLGPGLRGQARRRLEALSAGAESARTARPM